MAAPTVTWHDITFNSSGGYTNRDGSTTYPSLSAVPALAKENGVTKLDIGAVQAGKPTSVRCVCPKFTGSSVQNLRFWLESRNANASGSVNQNLSEANGWFFYHYVIARNASQILNHTFPGPEFSGGIVTDGQKTGSENLPSAYGTNQKFIKLPESEETASVANMKVSSVASGDFGPYIYLTVQTPTNAVDGLTDGWSYRMSFLYP